MTDEERRLIAERDLELINTHLEELTREADDLNQYEAPIDFDPAVLDPEIWESLREVPLSRKDAKR